MISPHERVRLAKKTEKGNCGGKNGVRENFHAGNITAGCVLADSFFSRHKSSDVIRVTEDDQAILRFFYLYFGRERWIAEEKESSRKDEGGGGGE